MRSVAASCFRNICSKMILARIIYLLEVFGHLLLNPPIPCSGSPWTQLKDIILNILHGFASYSGNCGATVSSNLSVNSLKFGALSIDFSAASLFEAQSISNITFCRRSSLRYRRISSSLAASNKEKRNLNACEDTFEWEITAMGRSAHRAALIAL